MSFHNLDAVAPLIIPILALCIPIVAIVAHYLAKSSSDRQRHDTIRELARAGQPIPPELLLEAQDTDWQRARSVQANPNRILIPALINVGLGLGLMGMFAVMSPGNWLWAIGLLPLCVGLGLTVYWAVERHQPAQRP